MIHIFLFCNSTMKACWYIANNIDCIHDRCSFSHNQFDIDRYQRYYMVDELCEYGHRCYYKCNKRHTHTKRLRDDDKIVTDESKRYKYDNNIEVTNLKNQCLDKELQIKELQKQLLQKDLEIQELKDDIKFDKVVSKLQCKLHRKNREMIAMQEHHKEVLKIEYMKNNHLHVKEVNKKFYDLFKSFRINFYNSKDDYHKLVDNIENYITDVSDNVKYQNLRMF